MTVGCVARRTNGIWVGICAAVTISCCPPRLPSPAEQREARPSARRERPSLGEPCQPYGHDSFDVQANLGTSSPQSSQYTHSHSTWRSSKRGPRVSLSKRGQVARRAKRRQTRNRERDATAARVGLRKITYDVARYVHPTAKRVNVSRTYRDCLARESLTVHACPSHTEESKRERGGPNARTGGARRVSSR